MSSEGTRPTRFIDKLRENQMFRGLAEPVTSGQFPSVRDAELLVRRDGLIITVEGWSHPEGGVVGEVMYAPDRKGSKTIFGQPYRKVTLFPGTYTPVPYAERGRLLALIDPALDQTADNPPFAKYKQIVDRDDIVAHLPGRRVYRKILSDPNIDTTHFEEDIADAQELLGTDFSGFDIGFTGAPLLGNVGNLHDVDVVFNGDLEVNLELAKRMRRFVLDNEDNRVIEGGKGWNIRYYNRGGSLMCNFFGYRDPNDAPLRDFQMEVIEPDVQIQARVTDETHTMYTPTVLDIAEVDLLSVGERRVRSRLRDNMKLIAYHTATRGECFSDDLVTANGALVEVQTPVEVYRAVLVTEREGIRNQTPTWENFYTE